MTNDDVLTKIEALFHLGEHPTTNPHEAANAHVIPCKLGLDLGSPRALEDHALTFSNKQFTIKPV